MNKLDKNLLMYISPHCEGKDCQIIMLFLYYGTIGWKNHEPYDFFRKSERNTAEELKIHRNSVHRSYERIIRNIEQGIFPFLSHRISRHKNYPVSEFRIDKDVLNRLFGDSNTSPIEKNTAPSMVPVKELTASHMVPVLPPQPNQYCPAYGTGINIVTHNKRMYTGAEGEDEVPTVEKQTDEFKKEKVEDMVKIQTDDLLQMLEIWNGLIRPQEPEMMRKPLEKRLREVLITSFDADIDKWKEHCARIASSHFLTGEKFTLCLSWALKPEWIEKVQQGKYDNFETKGENGLTKTPPEKLTLPTLEEVMATCQNDVDKKVKSRLYNKLCAEAYATWIHHTGASFYEEEGRVQVNSCGKFTQTTIKTRFWNEVEKAYA